MNANQLSTIEVSVGSESAARQETRSDINRLEDENASLRAYLDRVLLMLGSELVEPEEPVAAPVGAASYSEPAPVAQPAPVGTASYSEPQPAPVGAASYSEPQPAPVAQPAPVGTASYSGPQPAPVAQPAPVGVASYSEPAPVAQPAPEATSPTKLLRLSDIERRMKRTEETLEDLVWLVSRLEHVAATEIKA